MLAEAPFRSIRPVPRSFGAAEAATANAAPAANVPAAADLIARANLGGKLGYVVADAGSGRVLEAQGADVALPPASVAKAATALYALSTLGPEFRFDTRLIATGPVVDGTLNGDLILAGSGDPVLDTDTLARMAAELRAAGVRVVAGRFKVWAGALPYVRAITPEQPDEVGYNPAVSGLNLNYNRVYFAWTKADAGWAVTMDARSDNFRPAVSVARMSVVNRDLPTYTYKATRGVDEWTVASGALGNGGSRWLPVRRPDLYAGEVFQLLAAAQGIRMPAVETVDNLPGGTVLVSHKSAPLSALVRDMLLYSTNLTAEVIGLTASLARGARVTSPAASGREMSAWLAGVIGGGNPKLVDHSGLGDDSRVTASELVRLMVAAKPGGALHAHMKSIAPEDAQGKDIAGATYSIEAKTGTLNFVSTLAGYVTGPGAKVLAFAILSGDTARRDRVPLDQMERPDGGRAWTAQARWLQQQLIHRWADLYT